MFDFYRGKKGSAMTRFVAGGWVIESAFEQAFVNIVHSTWFGRYAREDSNFFRALHGNSPSNDELFFLPITMFLFFAWMVSRTRSVFFRGFVVLSSRLFSKLQKISLAVKMSTPERGKIRKIQRGR